MKLNRLYIKERVFSLNIQTKKKLIKIKAEVLINLKLKDKLEL